VRAARTVAVSRCFALGAGCVRGVVNIGEVDSGEEDAEVGIGQGRAAMGVRRDMGRSEGKGSPLGEGHESAMT